MENESPPEAAAATPPTSALTQETPPEAAAPSEMKIDFRGTQGSLFSLATRTALLTLVTLGIYRFWARTRIRKFFWSSTAPDGDPFEYTGNGLEKFLGFLIAVAVLAIYLGFFQVLLAFAGMSIFSGGDSEAEIATQTLASQATFILVIPLIFYAQYRGRRYILSRTRWRGVRFGVEQAAWGYVWRALLHWLATILTLGLLLPRQTFWLEKYRTDRTWFGNSKLEQTGDWKMLYPAMKHMLIPIGIMAAGALLFALTEMTGFLSPVFFSVFWLIYGYIHYQVHSFAKLLEYKTIGGTVRFHAEFRAGHIFWVRFFGPMLAGVCAGFVFAVFAIVAVNIMGGLQGIQNAFDPFNDLGLPTGGIFGLSILGVGYMLSLLMYGVFVIIFVTLPTLEHYITNIQILNPQALEEIEQRARDEMVEAEGFADALDVGAAI